LKRTSTTVAAYLKELPPERRAVIAAVRALVKRHLPAGYRESINWGHICYEVPLSRYPDTYNGQPLCYAAIAAQKGHNALYLTGAYQDPAQARRLAEAFRRAGKKLDMGKSCVRFRELDDLALDAIGEAIASTPPERFIAAYEASRASSRPKPKAAGGAKARR
jgi:hypothetical protein